MSVLFEPIEINGMVVPNRFMRSATNRELARYSILGPAANSPP